MESEIGTIRGPTFFAAVREFWRHYQKNRAAVAGLGVLTLFGFLAIFAHQVMPYDPFEQTIFSPQGSLDGIYKPPTSSHLMGTDDLGRDVFSRFIWGARNALLVGVVSAGLSASLGLMFGAIAGYTGGMTDGVIMRLADIFLVLPTFFTAMVTIAMWGRNQAVIIFVIGITIWPSTARLVRAEVMAFKSQDFIIAAKAVGASSWYIIVHELFPNVIFVAIVNASMQTAFAITIEASLAYLGLGDPAYLSWGWQLHYSMKAIRRAWWTATFPGFGITLIVVAFNLVGDGLNEALNPYLKER